MFCCLPHGAAASAVPQLLAGSARVVDFSADYRLSSAAVYEEWYGVKHVDPSRLGHTVYGLPELFREKIRPATLVANPGCYTSSAILALTPLVKAGLIEPANIIIDSKSGVSGAGRTPKLITLFPECNESLSAYSVGRHRHTPEIEEIVTAGSGRQTSVIFTPHLVPMDRGILSTIYTVPASGVTESRAMQVLREFYARRALCPRGRSFARHQGFGVYQFLRYHGPAGAGPLDPDQLSRQLDQRRLGRRGTKFQFDVRLLRNDSPQLATSTR